MPIRVALTLVAFMAILFPDARGPSSLCADCVVLQSGGEIRGALLPDGKGRAGRERVAIRTLSGALVEIAKQEAAEVIHRRPLLEEYETRRRAAPDTVQDQWVLAEWCRQQGLPKERQAHLARVIELDPEHVLAHRGLGHIREAGRWTTPDEAMAARGYVKFKGRHVLPQEAEVLARQAFVTQSEKHWYYAVKQCFSLIESDREDRRAQGLEKLRKIDKPDAVPALVKVLRATPEEAYRLLLVEALSQIEGERPVVPLAMQSVLDESSAVREAAIKTVRRKKNDLTLVTYLKYLKDPLNLLINRAAAALAQLGDQSAVPHLIEALITRHQFQMMLPEDDIEDLLDEQTGPVLMLPADYDPSTKRQTASGPQRAEEMIEMRVEKDHHNASVLAALQLLTEENFGFDVPAWRKWHAARRNSPRASPRGTKARP
jgi:hypothetical protein